MQTKTGQESSGSFLAPSLSLVIYYIFSCCEGLLFTHKEYIIYVFVDFIFDAFLTFLYLVRNKDILYRLNRDVKAGKTGAKGERVDDGLRF